MMYSNYPKLKRIAYLVLCLGILSLMCLPGTASATVTSSGTAYIDWSSVSITLGGAPFDPAAHFDPVLGFPSAFSGTQVQLNHDQTDVGFADFGDGTLPTSSSASLSNLNGSSISASAQTTTTAVPGVTNGLYSSLLMSVNRPDSVPFGQANSTLYNYAFIAPTNALLRVSVNYLLTNALTSDDPDGAIASHVSAGVFLYGYDADGNPMNDPLSAALAELNNGLFGVGDTGLLSDGGTLILTFGLTAGGLYDLGGETSATGQTVPEPATFLLLGLGLLALGGRELRNRRKRA